MNRSLSDELAPSFMGCFSVLILDNEVTVENFVAAPPLPWGRLVGKSRLVHDGRRVSLRVKP